VIDEGHHSNTVEEEDIAEGTSSPSMSLDDREYENEDQHNDEDDSEEEEDGLEQLHAVSSTKTIQRTKRRADEALFQEDQAKKKVKEGNIIIRNKKITNQLIRIN
jgi:hypothetical protein